MLDHSKECEFPLHGDGEPQPRPFSGEQCGQGCFRRRDCRVTRLEMRGDAGRGQRGVRGGGEKWSALGRMHRVPKQDPVGPRVRGDGVSVCLRCLRGGMLGGEVGEG